MGEHQQRFRDLGVNIAFVSSGTPEQAAAFEQAFCPWAKVYVDPPREAFKAFQLKRDWGSVASLRMLGRAVRAFGAGHRQGPTQGDALQLGGAFLIDTSGVLRFEQRSSYAGDHVDPAELLRCMRRLDPTQALG